MKAVVTGGAGFIGSHLVEELIRQGFNVHIIDNLISGKYDNIHPLATFHIEDICSDQAKQIILDEKPDVVFHLAAQADVSRSIQSPQYDADVNIKGTINLLEACRDASVGKFIFASTSAVYGNLQKDLITEQDATVPASYYGLSKLAAESYIRLFHYLYNLPYTILRYGNVYGPRQTPKGEGGVVAVFLERLSKGLSFNIHGDGEQTRDFIYVKDIVQANIAAIKKGNQEVVHASTTKKTSVNDLLKNLEYIHGSNIDVVYTEGRPGDIKHSCLDSEKAQKLLEWSSRVSVLEGLKETYTFSRKKA
ncbi:MULTISPECIES: NAD-dependent epimerase/dehydratase family protein [Priestia]|uniref:UDP-glucose 4-epimerase n=2 Tax=Priestia TaxID=2800373 RepID=A0A806TXE2_PRIMG|nr:MULTISPECIES: NAD-dependent epimerase/dehydratase family protein [Priestia]UPK52931.1 GDP-mannose 4,6-dehydratase [Bacillus sp. H8-1]AKP80287.1 UDP-glucose 4-epimerase [Priestia megaterium Q3]AWD68771.1 UDP-glucose 4-epimerase [Priestia megaterium]MBY0008261.1 GDP-mannose 4,6-dehydratase [Priestia aryabhattai]MBY0049962.1 GDP-mannose 4,6-dehydratase [Priestia aryabhattai]